MSELEKIEIVDYEGNVIKTISDPTDGSVKLLDADLVILNPDGTYEMFNGLVAEAMIYIKNKGNGTLLEYLPIYKQKTN